MIGKVSFDSVFGEIEDWEETLHEIVEGDYEGASNAKDELSHNEGWYNHSVITFDYKGKRYSIEYKEHTSDNVSDTEYEDLVCIGNADEMEETITKEDLNRTLIDYKKEIENLTKRNKELLTYKRTIDKLKLLSYENLIFLSEIFLKEKGNSKSNVFLTTTGEFFRDLAKMK